jgi:hypothetical protein
MTKKVSTPRRRARKPADPKQPDTITVHTLAWLPTDVELFALSLTDDDAETDGLKCGDVAVCARLPVQPYELAALASGARKFVGRFQPRGDCGQLIKYPLDDDPVVHELDAGEVSKLWRIVSVERADQVIREYPLTQGARDEGQLNDLRGKLASLELLPENEACRFQLEKEIYRLEKEQAASEWAGAARVLSTRAAHGINSVNCEGAQVNAYEEG